MNYSNQIQHARTILQGVVQQTPLLYHQALSERYQADIYLKREDLQEIRSYKIRGAYYKISSIPADRKNFGVVCASAGNHAQGVAWSCARLQIRGTIFMPATTPAQKIRQVKLFGQDQIEIVLTGDTFDDAYAEARRMADAQQSTFVHPFDDPEVIAGQGTIGLEILEQCRATPDFVVMPIGGGGLAAGVCSVFKEKQLPTSLIGCEPEGAPSMDAALRSGEVVTLDHIDKFVDGAAVKRVGELTFAVCEHGLDDMLLVNEGKICTTMLELYDQHAMVVEPAGALSIAALDQLGDKIRNKKVVCIVSGSNNDISRTEEIREKSLFYLGLKHYFLIEFPQRPGALKAFVSEVLGPDDDITYFQFSKKNNRESGPAVVGIELKKPEDLTPMMAKLRELQFAYQYLNDNRLLFTQLIG